MDDIVVVLNADGSREEFPAEEFFTANEEAAPELVAGLVAGDVVTWGGGAAPLITCWLASKEV